MLLFEAWARYHIAKAREARALYARCLEAKSVSPSEALRLALNHFLKEKLTLVVTEPKAPLAPEAKASPGSLSRETSAECPKRQNFARKLLIHRLLDPGPKNLFVGDMVLLRLQMDASSPGDVLNPKAKAALASSPSTCFSAPSQETWEKASLSGFSAQTAWDMRPFLASASVSPCSLGPPVPSWWVSDPPPSEAPSKAGLVRRVAALEGALMVSGDPEDPPFRLPKGHCWLLQPDKENPYKNLKGADHPVDEWDSRSTGPVPCSELMGRAMYVCHSPVHHEVIRNSLEALKMDVPVLMAELDVESLTQG